MGCVIFAFDDFELDARRLELRHQGKVLETEGAVLRLLAVLLRNAGHLVSKAELVEEVWQGRAVTDNVITITVARLRKTLGEKRGESPRLTTVYGRGYRFLGNVEQRFGLTTSSGVEGRASASPLVVGREKVFESLAAAHDQAASGHGRLCVLSGEAGIGKTYAVEAFARALGPAARVARGFCRESADTPPLSPWRRLLAEVWRSGHPADSDSDSTLDPALQWLLSEDREDAGADAIRGHVNNNTERRRRVFRAVTEFLSTVSGREPWLLVVEDLHRSDATSLDLLLHLLDEVAQQRMLIVATVRDLHDVTAGAESARVARVLAHANTEHIGLRRLREDEVGEYVRSWLGGAQEELGRAIFTRSEGNPFFMTELCRQVRDRGADSGDVLTVPETARTAMLERVARLDHLTRGVLSVAAVIGREFDLALLHAVIGGDLCDLMENLDGALSAEVVLGDEESPTTFVFRHELLRAALYDEMPRARRRDLHVRVGEALEQRLRAGDAVDPGDLAHHFHAALPAGDLRRTVHHCRSAAAHAAASFANASVVRHARQALAALELMESPSPRLRMHLLYLIAMYARADSSSAYEEATKELARAARQVGDACMQVRAAVMFNLHPGFTQLPGADRELRQAVDLLPPDEPAMKAVALATLALATPTCFSARQADVLLDEAVPLAQASGSRAARYTTGICELYLRGGPSHAEAATRIAEQLALLAQQNPGRMSVLPVDLAIHRAVTAAQRGDLPATLLAADGAAAHCRMLHHRDLLWHAERMRVLIELQSGGVVEALPALARLHARAEPGGLVGVAAFRAFDEAMLHGELGGLKRLDDTLRQALKYELHDPPSLWSMKVRALSALGLADEARTALRARDARSLADLPGDRDLLGTLGHIARAAIMLGSMEHATAAAERLAEHPNHYCSHVAFWCEGSVPQLLGEVALASGDAERAIPLLRCGLERALEARLTTCATQARLELARALLQGGRAHERRQADDLLTEARRSATKHGMQRLVVAAESVQERAG